MCKCDFERMKDTRLRNVGLQSKRVKGVSEREKESEQER